HALPRPLREVNPKIPASIESVVMKAMAKRPDDRQQSADELAVELESAIAKTATGGLGVVAGTGGLGQPITGQLQPSATGMMGGTSTPLPRVPTPRPIATPQPMHPSTLETDAAPKSRGALIGIIIALIV